MRCAERDTHEWNPITSLIQCHSLTVGQTPNLLRIVFTITSRIVGVPTILLTSRIVGECSYSIRSRIIGSVFEHLFTSIIPKPSCGSGALGWVLFTGAPAGGLFLYRGFKFVWLFLAHRVCAAVRVCQYEI